MTDKAYIVANEQQEREVLIDLENQGYTWDNLVRSEPTVNVRKLFDGCEGFPYALFANENNHRIRWDKVELSNGLEIVYDGRKEEQMSDKYVVSQEFMNELEEWKKRGNTEVYFVGSYDLSMLPDYVKRWWNYPEINNFECNNRLIAIIRWVNGEDVFEVEKPKKWVVRSDSKDSEGDYWYVRLDSNEHDKSNVGYDIETATRFNTKEEAQSWANSHQEVVEV